jgi:hypothetical protein
VLVVVPGARSVENAEAVVAAAERRATEAGLEAALAGSSPRRAVNTSFVERQHGHGPWARREEGAEDVPVQQGLACA